jgi:hypothetical protein
MIEQQLLLHFKISFKLISFRYDDDGAISVMPRRIPPKCLREVEKHRSEVKLRVKTKKPIGCVVRDAFVNSPKPK